MALPRLFKHGLVLVGPRTVVWLNNAQLYLDHPELGERVAAGLRELVHDRARAPVLVLATLWREDWYPLTTRARPDTHAEARELLAVCRTISVPDAFTEADHRVLATVAASDPRLHEAAVLARGGEVIQYLAGAPELLQSYEGAPPATRALIHAAMDARRMGCGPQLPLALLEAAALSELTEPQRAAARRGSWLSEALTHCDARPDLGIPGILTPVGSGTADSGGGPAHAAGAGARQEEQDLYQLADYLDLHGRRKRANQMPAPGFWAAAANHARSADLTALGRAARKRGLYRDAARLFKIAATVKTPTTAAGDLVDLMHLVRDSDARPADWAVAHVSLESPVSVGSLLLVLRAAGFGDQISTLLKRDPANHVALDDRGAVVGLLQSMLTAGISARTQEQASAWEARGPGSDHGFEKERMQARIDAELWMSGARDQVTALAPGCRGRPDRQTCCCRYSALRPADRRETRPGPGAA
jgi:hypothetical protein